MTENLSDEQDVEDERSTTDDHDVLALQQPIDLAELQPVVAMGPDSTIAEVVETMVEKRVGCIVITADNQLAGLFTERDLLCKVIPRGVDISSTPVSSVMTKNPETLPADSPLVYALQRMSIGGYRHVPLMNDEGKAIAIISMRDIVQHIVSLYPDQICNIPDRPSSWSRRDGA